jgi:outer membrane protein OmpA-like peptidoglycan-associated protein
MRIQDHTYRALLILLVIGCLSIRAQVAHAQVRIDTAGKISDLVGDHLLGKRMKVKDVRFLGERVAIGHFTDTSAAPLIGEGILLSTGRIFDAKGPNKVSNMSTDLMRKGDRALEYIGKGPTFDAAVLEFAFQPQLDYISFNFIFASEEYIEYVGSPFNDVFAFYITGPNIKGVKNLAILPDPEGDRYIPITVNTVNHNLNSANYIDNNHFNKRGQRVPSQSERRDQELLRTYEFDGFTTLLRAECAVIPGETYKIRIAIADVGDHQYDSAVLLEGKSFSSYPSNPTERANLIAKETGDFRRRFQPVLVGNKPLETPDVALPTPEADPATPTKVEPVPAPAWTPADLAPIKGNPWRFEFDFDSAELLPRHQSTLDSIANYLKKHPKARLRIEGHTDAIGASAYNIRLSERRAESVRGHLQGRGIPPERTETGHYGATRPIESNAAESGRARNRRVEIILLK